MFIIYNRKLKPTGNFNAHLYRMYVVITPSWENQCVVCLKKTRWGAAHSGSHRSQCKIVQISIGRCVPSIIFFD